jgi:hypothetical protein
LIFCFFFIKEKEGRRLLTGQPLIETKSPRLLLTPSRQNHESTATVLRSGARASQSAATCGLVRPAIGTGLIFCFFFIKEKEGRRLLSGQPLIETKSPRFKAR